MIGSVELDGLLHRGHQLAGQLGELGVPIYQMNYFIILPTTNIITIKNREEVLR